MGRFSAELIGDLTHGCVLTLKAPPISESQSLPACCHNQAAASFSQPSPSAIGRSTLSSSRAIGVEAEGADEPGRGFACAFPIALGEVVAVYRIHFRLRAS